jgi:NAD(P)-dependent dehydrogenase (short-subunit alcohol dehydrogenase family)
VPLGRAGLPDDVARTVLFAASPLAAYLTGSTLRVLDQMLCTNILGRSRLATRRIRSGTI